MYDIIGDIHGYYNSLKDLLSRLGYTDNGKYWAHPCRIAVFAGDFLDRGPFIRETVVLVKAMCENGAAHAVMGNHEYNAIAYFTKNQRGRYLRPHTKKNDWQISVTLKAYRLHEKQWQDHLVWFQSLPLFMEFKTFRVIHACWDYKLVNYIRNKYHARLSEELIQLAAQKGTLEYIAIESLLKGKEVKLPGGACGYYVDKDNNKRRRIRFKWWTSLEQQTYRKIAVNYEEQIPNDTVPITDFKGHIPYSKDAPPVFFGHYWKSGTPEILAENICCVDYSIAKKDKIVAYRFNGEQKLDNKNFVSAACSSKDLSLF